MAGTWQPLINQPTFSTSTMLLLTDGTIICQETQATNWWRLSPDKFGNYVDGLWTIIPPMKNTRLYYASAVLADGRVLVSGGEDSDAGDRTNASEIFNPFKNVWTSIAPPTGWDHIGDAPCCLLPNGKVIIGSIYDNKTAIYDPITNTWTQSAKKEDISSTEETWTLLPDNTILTVECKNHPRAEKYVISKDEWVSAGSTPVELVQDSSAEIGPAILLPNGNVFAIGATGHTLSIFHQLQIQTSKGHGLQDQISLQTQMEI